KLRIGARADAVVVARSGHAELDLVAVTEHLLAVHAAAVHVGAVQAPEVAKHELRAALLDDAMLLRRDLVHELDAVGGMPTEAVEGHELDRLLTGGRAEDQTGHRTRHLTALAARDSSRIVVTSLGRLLRFLAN